MEQLNDIEELLRETERAKQKFKDEYKKDKQFEAQVIKQQAPVIEAIERVADRVEHAEEPKSTSLEESNEILIDKIEEVLSAEYDGSPNDLKTVLKTFYADGTLPVMIILFNHDKDLRSKITIGTYQRHGNDILVFYAHGGSNARHLDSFKQTELYKNYKSYLNRYTVENGEQIIELYENFDGGEDDSINDYVDDTDPEGIFTEEGHYCDGLKYYNNPQQLVERLAKLHATFAAGNTASEVFNEANSIIKELMKIKYIGKEKYLELVKLFN